MATEAGLYTVPTSETYVTSVNGVFKQIILESIFLPNFSSQLSFERKFAKVSWGTKRSYSRRGYKNYFFSKKFVLIEKTFWVGICNLQAVGFTDDNTHVILLLSVSRYKSVFFLIML